MAPQKNLSAPYVPIDTDTMPYGSIYKSMYAHPGGASGAGEIEKQKKVWIKVQRVYLLYALISI